MSDVKLLKPERLSDNPDGGGLSTGIEIVDNQVNNLFDDVSRVDRVNGDVSLRKTFVQAVTEDTELYSGLHVIVQAPPQDPRVDAVLFRTGSWSDERDGARQYVERFLDPAVITRMIPYDRQLKDQRVVLAFQREEVAVPEIGDVYVLENQATGATEFVRLTNVAHEVQVFTDADGGEFRARVITMTIAYPLSQEFPGSQPNRRFVAGSNASILRKTTPSAAAKYYGTVPLAQDTDPGDITVRLGSIYGQLVPSANSESAITDARPAGTTAILRSADDEITIDAQQSWVEGTTYAVRTGFSIEPGTLEVRVVHSSGSSMSRWRDDDGDGVLTRIDGTTVDDEPLSVDYAHGEVTFRALATNPWTIRSIFIPAVTYGRSSLTYQQPIKLNTRGYIYLASLVPAPVPGSTVVSYRANGRWYELTDDGTGALVGESGTGTGLVNYVTGTVSVTLGALPDIGSSIVYSWGGNSELEIRTGDTAILPPRVELTLQHELDPDSLSLSWKAGGATKTATCNAAGIISGDASGYVVPETRQVVFRPAVIPDDNSTITAEYGDYSEATAYEQFEPTESDGTIELTLADPPKAGTVAVSLTYFRDGDQGQPFTFVLKDNGSGGLRSVDYDTPEEIESVGSVNYTTGEIVLPASITYMSAQPVYAQVTDALPGRSVDPDTGYYSASDVPRKKIVGQALTSGAWHFNDSGTGAGAEVSVSYVVASASVGSPYSEEHPMPPLRLDLTPNVTNAIIPGSVMFEFGGRKYFDRGGLLYHSIHPITGAGSVGGSINYTTGVVLINDYVSNVAPALSVKSLLTEVRPLPVSVVHARTSGAPLRPASFFVQANRSSDGAMITGVADSDGKISTADMHGYVDVTTGVFSIAFGRYVLDSALTVDDKAEPWYDAANVDSGGYIWRPREIVPGSLRYSCVVQTTLPLDPTIIGVNPVRLPIDGRVAVVRAGDTLVFHDTQSETLASPTVDGSTENLSRGSLASVVIYDAEGTAVDPGLYTVDLEAGTITWPDPVDLDAYTYPLTALHTIEDMRLCIDAQITGQVTLAHPLTHGYTAANSLCSSALLLGDVQARVENVFALNTWTGNWDATDGTPPGSGANYNDVNYPLVVDNKSAITQRWRLAFTSSTAFNIVAEELGIVGTGTTSADVAPLNPATDEPYFTLDKDGFGTGWATGNTIRFNTVAAGGPMWIARTVRSGPATYQDDLIRLQVRWDKD